MNHSSIFLLGARIKGRLYGDDNPAEGFGRDRSEAAAHAGFGVVSSESEYFEECEIHNVKDDIFSLNICKMICDFYISDVTDLPLNIKAHLQSLIHQGLYADAVYLVTHVIWDGEVRMDD